MLRPLTRVERLELFSRSLSLRALVGAGEEC